MSLVAYDSSGEESEEDTSERETVTNVKERQNEETQKITHTDLHSVENSLQDTNTDSEENKTRELTPKESGKSLLFNKLPEPKRIDTITENVIEEDDIIPTKTRAELLCEASLKKERGPVKITIPSLSEFKDIDEENTKANKLMPSKKGTGLFALLPPPKAEGTKPSNALIPRVLNSVSEKKTTEQIKPREKVQMKMKHIRDVVKEEDRRNFPGISQYDSNSSDEEEDCAKRKSIETSTTDFFSLNSKESIDGASYITDLSNDTESKIKEDNRHHLSVGQSSIVDKVLVSNIMNLPKEEILLKNKAEVGPKLPVPEQEYNVDSQGNVAFDEKAIEYLCGRRGIKRKEKEIDERNIIEINGEDIKPDEREWLVKALTEEPVQRPVSMHSMYGGGSQSKKKHQITYLAQQAKAMEVELKNQWAQNRVSRKQTQSKYGF